MTPQFRHGPASPSIRLRTEGLTSFVANAKQQFEIQALANIVGLQFNR